MNFHIGLKLNFLKLSNSQTLQHFFGAFSGFPLYLLGYGLLNYVRKPPVYAPPATQKDVVAIRAK
ncbi:MAG TPA: hypothetical protein DCQ50_02115 [Chryseobacterium sp.]|nr:hypothetical protein [Chryseobacterium sp.]